MLWDPFLMKKLLKSVICGFVNSAPCTVHGRLGQQLWLKKKKKGKTHKEKTVDTQTCNPNTYSLSKPQFLH